MTEPDPDRFITTAEAASEMPAGLVIIQPEDLLPEDMSLIPNLPTERTATPLLQLLALAADQFDMEEGQLVQLAGCIREHGTAGAYQMLAAPGSLQSTGFAVAWYDDGVFGAETYPTDPVEPGDAENRAKTLYDAKGEELDRA